MIAHVCGSPLSPELLASYWLGDLAAADEERVDAQLMTCEACSRASARMGLLTEAIASHGRALTIPPLLAREELAAAQHAGLRSRVVPLDPGARVVADLTSDLHLLVFELQAKLVAGERYCVQIGPLDGEPACTFEDVPADAEAGQIIVCCQRHLAGPERTTLFTLRQGGPSGPVVAKYMVDHEL